MKLTELEKELVAIGAAIAGNCMPCLQWHYKKCVELGLDKEQLKEVIDMAKTVKEVPIEKIYDLADKLQNQ